MDDVIHILPDDIEIVDVSEYSEDLTEYFSDMPEVARLLLKLFLRLSRCFIHHQHSLI